MKIKRKRRFSLKKIIIIALGVAILAAVIIYFIYRDGFGKTTPDNTGANINYSQPTEEQKKAGEEVEKEAEKNTSNTTPQQPTSATPSSPKKPTSISITSALQDGAGTLKVRTVISISDATPGTCTITVTQGATNLFSASAKSERRSEYSTCQGFDITKAELKNATGQITISVAYSGAEYEGSADTQVILQ